MEARDPALFASYGMGHVLYANNSDGSAMVLEYQRPFYSVRTPWAVAAGASRIVEQDSIYEASKAISTYVHEWREFSGSYDVAAARWARSARSPRHGHARALLAATQNDRVRLAERAANEGLSVRTLERLAGAVTVLSPLTLTAIAPTTGPASGGTMVTITGAGIQLGPKLAGLRGILRGIPVGSTEPPEKESD